jgi:hypothetical protein
MTNSHEWILSKEKDVRTGYFNFSQQLSSRHKFIYHFGTESSFNDKIGFKNKHTNSNMHTKPITAKTRIKAFCMQTCEQRLNDRIFDDGCFVSCVLYRISTFCVLHLLLQN